MNNEFSWNKKNVLITGISGFLAPHIAEKLLNLGANVIGSVHDNKKIDYGKITGLYEKITLAQADINDLTRLEEIVANYEIDYIFHCAANSIVRQCATNPVGCFQTNIIGTMNILEAARRVGGVKGIACMESDKSYGSFDPEDLPYKEGQAIKPTNVYEVSKACSGLIAEAYSNNYSLPVFTIRAANLYGPGDMNMSRLIPGSIMRLFHSESPVLYSGVAKYIREFLYVEDAAESLIKLMEKIDITKSNIFNLGSGEIHQIENIIKLMCEKIDSNINPVMINKSSLFKEIEQQYLDIEKVRKVLTDYKTVDLDEGLNKTISWYKEYLNQIPRPE
ncbi:GDP-mannose 4,6-dehydratase [Candidatus Thioglobus sp.]|nr:GDP-mannose 4,6-dehydratase [Candidatus Thioglobus sp.]